MSVLQVNCPTCGSPVEFKGEFSTHAVCGACDSLLIRKGVNVDLIGKVAEIQPDGSPLQVGTQGSYKGKAFQIVGRIQLGYGDGYWNEWYLFFSDGQDGWLGEAMGEYFINTQKEATSLPDVSQIALGDVLNLDGEEFVVSGTTTNQVISFEGELPFVMQPQQPCPAYDLRSASGRAATIDYSESPPMLFVGEYQSFQELEFNGLLAEGESRGGGQGQTVSARAAGVDKFNCPSCGAPHSVEGGVRSKVLVCEYCGSAVDISDSDSLGVLWQEESMRQKIQSGVSIPLGTKGTVEGVEFKVIGFVKKSVTYEGVNYPWTEYLLYERCNGYRWLVESDGHFNFMETLQAVPTSNGRPVGRPSEAPIQYNGEVYKHFQTSTARVDAVAGEFYWRVKVGENATNFDYVCPPRMLSMEASPTGFVWAIGTYLTAGQLQHLGFEVKPTPVLGVGPNQPNPHVEEASKVWKTFWICAVAALVLMVSGLLTGGGKTIYNSGPMQYETHRTFKEQVSKPFEIKGHGNVSFLFDGRVSQRWLFFDTRLVNTDTKKEYKVGRTVENYYGKGERKQRVRVAGIPPGTYRLYWNIKSGTTNTVAETADPKKKSEKVTYSIELTRGARVWGWFWFMLLLLIPLPLYLTVQRSRFETKRWYNSDHG